MSQSPYQTVADIILERDNLRAALRRLLWRAVADGDQCDADDRADRCDGDPRALDICQAMRALGYGQHFRIKIFESLAIAETAPKRAPRSVTTKTAKAVSAAKKRRRKAAP